MFSAIKYIYNSYVNPEKTKEYYRQKFEEECDKWDQLEEKEQTIAKLENEVKERQKEIEQKDCIKKSGLITSLEQNHGMIDNHLPFDLKLASMSEDLKVGHRVEFLAYKTPGTNILKVIKIKEILNQFWDDAPPNLDEIEEDLDDPNPVFFSTHHRKIPGVVVRRDQHILTVNTGQDADDIPVDMETVSLEFVPQVHDRVILNCKVQTDEGFFDSAGEVLEVIKVYPDRLKTVKTEIAVLNDNWGILDKDSFFTFDILPTGYAPSIRDKVKVDLIETEAEGFNWRCIKLQVLEKSSTLGKIMPDPIEEVFIEENGIKVTAKIVFKLENVGDSETKEIVLQNVSQMPQRIEKVHFKKRNVNSQLEVIEPRMNKTIILPPGAETMYRMRCKARTRGYSEESFVIQFEAFSIYRTIEIEVGKVTEIEKENRSYRQNSRNKAYAYQVWSKESDPTKGVRPFNQPRFVAKKFGWHTVPNKLREIVLASDGNKKDMISELEREYSSLREELNFKNYINRFQNLIHLEEIEFYINIRQYDKDRAFFTRENEYLSLEIENLAEKRPSLVVGDSLIAWDIWADTNRCFEGVIHKVLHDRVLLKFNEQFQTKYNGQDYRIEFKFSRATFRKQHYAVNLVVKLLGQEFLFPTKPGFQKNPQLDVELNSDQKLVSMNEQRTYDWFNPNLNLYQKIAVKTALRGDVRPMPFIIFGPPGTGKTMTVVEAILQISKRISYSRILVATPSNSSGDLIATRLIESGVLNPGDFVRLVGQNLVEKDLIPEHLKPYCATADIAVEGTSKDAMIITESGLKLKCPKKHLGRHRITIGTCSTLGTLHQLGFPEGHFTHVIIDEAGQCKETEVMIPISLVNRESGQIILAGDALQLGPIVLSRYAAEKGLDMSFLERLLNRVPYTRDYARFKQGGYDNRLVTKLNYNYRSIPSVLKTYNDIFYNSELLPMVDGDQSRESNLLEELQDILPTSTRRAINHGVFFMGVQGENKQGNDSPSWYNEAEAKQIFLMCVRLYRKGVSNSRIGIITPYQKQARTIRNVFQTADIPIPKIGSVEEFQGQERDIILISTVRSTRNLLNMDLRYSLGFVQSAKRMNVALSRARALLIVVGNPYLLALDGNWKKFIKYCMDSDTYSGPEITNLFSEKD